MTKFGTVRKTHRRHRFRTECVSAKCHSPTPDAVIKSPEKDERREITVITTIIIGMESSFGGKERSRTVQTLPGSSCESPEEEAACLDGGPRGRY